MARRLLLACLAGLLVAACGTASTPRPRPGPAATPEPSQDLLFTVAGPGAERLMVLGSDAGTDGARTLPAGVPSRDWRTVYTATVDAAGTTVRALDARSGQALRSTRLDGRFQLPVVGLHGLPEGLAADGDVLVLAADRTGGSSRFAVLDTKLRSPARLVELPGDWAYDAVAPDGSVLYLIQHLSASDRSRYVVRAYEVAAGRLRDGVITDKRNPDERMAGYPVTRVADDEDGWVYTLYRNPKDHSFVHALNVLEGFAFCIDLPGKQGGERDRLWSLAYGPGHKLYAVNAGRGLVAELSTEQFEVIRHATFAPTPASPASAGLVATTADGSLLVAGAGRGLVAIRTDDLKPQARWLEDRTLDGLVPNADGSRLYALSQDRDQILRLDPRTGTVLEERAAGGSRALLAAVPR